MSSISPQSGDKNYSHIFLPDNNEYTLDQNTMELNVSSNVGYYKVIDIVNGTSMDMPTDPIIVPTCPGCDSGSGGCELSKIKNGNCWQICCEDDTANPEVCTKCQDLKWIKNDNSPFSNNPVLVIRVSGNLTIQ